MVVAVVVSLGYEVIDEVLLGIEFVVVDKLVVFVVKNDVEVEI
jgi:hypothetical protein